MASDAPFFPGLHKSSLTPYLIPSFLCSVISEGSCLAHSCITLCQPPPYSRFLFLMTWHLDKGQISSHTGCAQHGFLLSPSSLPGFVPLSCSVYSWHCHLVTLLNISCIMSVSTQNSLMAPLHSESSSLSQTDKAFHRMTSGPSISLLLSWLLPKWPSTEALDMFHELSSGLCFHCPYA